MKTIYFVSIKRIFDYYTDGALTTLKDIYTLELHKIKLNFYKIFLFLAFIIKLLIYQFKNHA